MAKSVGVVVNFNKLPDMLKNNPKRADAAVNAMALDGERFAKQSMEDSPASGNSYVVGTGQIHIASSPGNPPRIDTGTLINSIHVRRAGVARYMVVAGVDYAIILEFGSSKVAARPFMVPMVVYLQQNADQFFDDLADY
jgi:hypothetical protein